MVFVTLHLFLPEHIPTSAKEIYLVMSQALGIALFQVPMHTDGYKPTKERQGV